MRAASHSVAPRNKAVSDRAPERTHPGTRLRNQVLHEVHRVHVGSLSECQRPCEPPNAGAQLQHAHPRQAGRDQAWCRARARQQVGTLNASRHRHVRAPRISGRSAASSTAALVSSIMVSTVGCPLCSFQYAACAQGVVSPGSQQQQAPKAPWAASAPLWGAGGELPATRLACWLAIHRAIPSCGPQGAGGAPLPGAPTPDLGARLCTASEPRGGPRGQAHGTHVSRDGRTCSARSSSLGTAPPAVAATAGNLQAGASPARDGAPGGATRGAVSTSTMLLGGLDTGHARG